MDSRVLNLCPIRCTTTLGKLLDQTSVFLSLSKPLPHSLGKVLRRLSLFLIITELLLYVQVRFLSELHISGLL